MVFICDEFIRQKNIIIQIFVLFPVLYIRIRRRFHNPDPDPRGQKWPTKTEKVKKLNFLKCFWELLCFLDIRPRDKKMAIFDQKDRKNFQLYFFLNFWSSKPWIRIRIWIHLKWWIRFRIRIRINESGSLTLPFYVWL